MLNREQLFWIRCGAVLGGMAVVFGAFAAHGLEDHLLALYGGKSKEILGESIPAARKHLGDFKTAAEYQMYHSLALIALGLLPHCGKRRTAAIAGWSFLVGILLFSGSLYLLVLTGVTKLGMITPIGGTLFIVGWVAMAISACSSTREEKPIEPMNPTFPDDTEVVQPRT